MDDDASEEEFFKQFESMFSGNAFGMGFDMFEDDIDLFTEMLEKDTKFMKKMFSGLGSGYRVRGGGAKRKKQK